MSAAKAGLKANIAAVNNSIPRNMVPLRIIVATIQASLSGPSVNEIRISARPQRLIEVSDQVFLVLDADRQPHHIGGRARLDLGGVIQLAVGGRGWMNDQRTGVADIGQMREQLQLRDQIDTRVIAALEAEGKDGACALRRIFAREIVVFVAV